MATRTPKIPARSTLLNSSLDGMDDLFDFKTKEDLSQPEQENGGTGITEMDFAVMEPLPNHKFKLYTGQRLWDMVDSIREFGILEPLIVWVHDGKNTILSGHNRQNAGSIAGLTKGPVIIRENLTYEDAILIATETNLRQRSFDDFYMTSQRVQTALSGMDTPAFPAIPVLPSWTLTPCRKPEIILSVPSISTF